MHTTLVPRRGTKVLRHKPQGAREPRHGRIFLWSRTGGRDLLLTAPTATGQSGHSGPTHTSTPGLQWADGAPLLGCRYSVPTHRDMGKEATLGSPRPGFQSEPDSAGHPQCDRQVPPTKMRNKINENSSPATATISGQDVRAHAGQALVKITSTIRLQHVASAGPEKAVQPPTRPIRRPRTPPPGPSPHCRAPNATEPGPTPQEKQ